MKHPDVHEVPLSDLAPETRASLEAALGVSLPVTATVSVRFTEQTGCGTTTSALLGSASLPAWCQVFEGLSNQEIADVEQVALDRGSWVRPSA